MPFYPPLRIRRGDSAAQKAWKRRTASKLLELRSQLREHIFGKSGADEEAKTDKDEKQWLRVATWNIREFDSEKYGGRLTESYFYIAEIISQFDLVALQEVREDRHALEEVMSILGRKDWEYIATDVTEGTPGNRERMVFVYNKKKVWFRHIAGEITLKKASRIIYPHEAHLRDTSGLKLELPEGETLQSPRNVPTRKYRGQVKLDGDLTIKLPAGTKVELPKKSKLFFPDGFEVEPTGENGQIVLDQSATPTLAKQVMVDLPTSALAGDSLQFARTPFLVSFQCGWLKFMLCTVHIYYGKGKQGLKRRNDEIHKLTQFLAERAASESDSDADNYFIVLGDFNIIGRDHETWKSLHSNNFEVPEELTKLPGSNVSRNKAYDQIAFWKRPGRSRRGNTTLDVGQAGIFDFFKYVFQQGKDDEEGKEEKYYASKVRSNVTYREWRTYQMSDHLPMWLELRVDFGDDYLQRIAGD